VPCIAGDGGVEHRRPQVPLLPLSLLPLPHFSGASTMRDLEGETVVEGGGWRRRWPHRRHARSPKGERAAVELLSDGACGPVPRAVHAVEVRRVHGSPVCPCGAHQDDTGGGDDGGNPQVGSLFRHPLTFGSRVRVRVMSSHCFDSIQDQFLVPFFSQERSTTWHGSGSIDRFAGSSRSRSSGNALCMTYVYLYCCCVLHWLVGEDLHTGSDVRSRGLSVVVWWSIMWLQRDPVDRTRVWSGELQWRLRTSCLEPVALLPLIALHDRGPPAF
jgi:hypothetical protein